jgi:hypothetical protein
VENESQLVLNYGRLLLTQNPFPYVSVPDEEPTIFYDQEKALRTLTSVVASTHTTGSSNHAVVVGSYGSGKSHTLKYIGRFINKELNKKSKRAVAFYIPHPGAGILDIYRSIVTDLGPSLISKLSNQVDDESHYQFELHRPIRMISQKSSDTLNAWRWLTGERLDTERRNRLGVGRNIDDAFANQAFKQLMILLQRAGYTLVSLLIDELETVNELDNLRRQKLFNTLRHLLDDNPRNLSVIFGCTPAGWDEIVGNAYALARRISRNIVYLETLDEKTITIVIGGYIEKSRVESSALNETFKRLNLDQEGQKIFPFMKSVIPELLRLSQGNISEVIKCSNVVIDRAVMAQRELIDAETLNQLLPEFQK